MLFAQMTEKIKIILQEQMKNEAASAHIAKVNIEAGVNRPSKQATLIALQPSAESVVAAAVLAVAAPVLRLICKPSCGAAFGG
jgi:hypothetical protein